MKPQRDNLWDLLIRLTILHVGYKDEACVRITLSYTFYLETVDS